MSDSTGSAILRILAQLVLRRTLQLGAVVTAAALVQGILVYAKYGILHRHQAHPIVPAGGCVTAPSRRKRAHSSQHTKRILIIGDSLAVGVGCSGSHPSLPIAIARGLSERWGGVPVEWESIGVVGGDTNTILAAVQTQLNTRHTDYHYDVVVVIAGLNDMKHCTLPWFWKQAADGKSEAELVVTTTPRKIKNPQEPSGGSIITKVPKSPKLRRGGPAGFECDLHQLVRTIKSTSPHHNVTVVLPGLPVRFSPFLSLQPLATFLHPLMSLWDSKKEQVARACNNVHFVKPPTSDELCGMLSNARQLKNAVPSHTPANTHNRLPNQDTDIHTNTPTSTPLATTLVATPDPTEGLVRYFSSKDQVHPNDLGYYVWGLHIAQSLEESLFDSNAAIVEVDPVALMGRSGSSCNNGGADPIRGRVA